MKKYYYAVKSERMGPYTFEELREIGLTQDTMVWYEGMNDWKQARDVSALDGLFTDTPPLISNQYSPELLDDKSSKQLPKTWLIESILVTLFCCLPFGIAGIVFSSRVESFYYAGKFDEAYKASADAKKWTLIGFGLAIVSYLIAIIFYVIIFGFVLAYG